MWGLVGICELLAVFNKESHLWSEEVRPNKDGVGSRHSACDMHYACAIELQGTVAIVDGLEHKNRG